MAGGWVVNVCVSKRVGKYMAWQGRCTFIHGTIAQEEEAAGPAWHGAVHVDLRDWRGLACRREGKGELCFVLCGTVVDDDWFVCVCLAWLCDAGRERVSQECSLNSHLYL